MKRQLLSLHPLNQFLNPHQVAADRWAGTPGDDSALFAANCQTGKLLMPRYFFDVANGHRLFDASGFVCEDDFAALIRGSLLAIGVSLDRPEDDPGRRIAVINDEGREIGTVPVYSTPS
jgi:hypothetical protein